MQSKKLIKYLGKKVLQPLARKYLSRSRHYNWKNIKLVIRPGVFHPGLFFSTKVLLEYMENQLQLQSKQLLELGAGSGLVSIYSAKKGAFVTATDISLKAIINIKENAQRNFVSINIILSNLFQNIDKDTVFDVIVINPPYYPENAELEHEYAWNCGENFEYFHSLFRQLSTHIHPHSKTTMVLSETASWKL